MKDLEVVYKIVDSMGVPNDTEHRIISINPTKDQLQQAYKTILRKQVKHIHNNTPLFLFVYFGGHGVGHKSHQYCCLNSNNPNEALFNIEYKLRHFTENIMNTMRIFAIYDCCNTPLSCHKGIHEIFEGKGNADGILADPDVIRQDGDLCTYLHLSPARPSGIAAANAENVKKMLKWMEQYALQSPTGFLRITSDIVKIPGGNCVVSGGDEYLIPFKSE
jgi:hypothetical protein